MSIKQKVPFYKKILISIKDFENYNKLINETIVRTILYSLFLVMILSLATLICQMQSLPNMLEEAYKIANIEPIQDINKNVLYIIAAISSYIGFTIGNFIAMLIDILILAILGLITSKMIKMKIDFSIAWKVATYSITLPVVLNIIYMMINNFTGFTIKYFQIMYVLVSYVYMITALIILKLDEIKNKEAVKELEEQEKNIKAGIDYEDKK